MITFPPYTVTKTCYFSQGLVPPSGKGFNCNWKGTIFIGSFQCRLVRGLNDRHYFPVIGSIPNIRVSVCNVILYCKYLFQLCVYARQTALIAREVACKHAPEGGTAWLPSSPCAYEGLNLKLYESIL